MAIILSLSLSLSRSLSVWAPLELPSPLSLTGGLQQVVKSKESLMCIRTNQEHTVSRLEPNMLIKVLIILFFYSQYFCQLFL